MDEINELLIQALALLEDGWAFDAEGTRETELMWAAHEHVQRAWGLYAKHEAPSKLSKDALEFMGKRLAAMAIADAAYPQNLASKDKAPAQALQDSFPRPVHKPWQVFLHFVPGAGLLSMRVSTHTHGSIAFSESAAEYCGGAVERDEDGYIVRCNLEGPQVEAAREIARMSALG